MTVLTFPMPSDTPRNDRERLEDEKTALIRRLASLSTVQVLGVLERARERKALRDRIAEIDDLLHEIDHPRRPA